MRRDFLKSTLALTAVGTSAFAHPSLPRRAQQVAAFRMFVEEQRAAAGLPALSVGIANRSGVIAVEQSGVRSFDAGSPVESGDVFHVGSVTKSMTATMIARLVERGLIDWQTTPADLWPREEMDPAFAEITLESMLGHRGGFAPMESDEDVATVPVFPGDARAQRAAYAAWIMRQPPFSEVGEHVYSNAGYGFAAAMAERATDTSWEILIRDELFRPLGMKTAGLGWPSADQPRGHYFSDGRFRPHDLNDGYRLAAFIAPAGDAFASSADMLAYGLTHLRGPDGAAPLLKVETWLKLHDAPMGDYALGWNVRSFGIHHLGSAGTFIASLIVSPGQDLVVFTGINGAGFPGSDALISRIASRAFRDFALPAA